MTRANGVIRRYAAVGVFMWSTSQYRAQLDFWQRTCGAGLPARLKYLQPPTTTLQALLPLIQNWLIHCTLRFTLNCSCTH